MSNYWKANNAEAYSLFYCEEYMKSFLSGYTGGKGQFHLSMTLSDKRDMCCQFAAYLRPANLDAQQRCTAFEKKAVPEGAASISFADYMQEKAVLLCVFIWKELDEAFGKEGAQLYANALRRFEKESEAMLEDIAFRRGIPCDRRLLESAFPFSLREPSTLWDRLSAEEACALFMKTVAAPLAARYDKAAACAE